MNLFKSHRKCLKISDKEQSVSVGYLGSVTTVFVRGEGCVDRPIDALWTAYLQRLHDLGVDDPRRLSTASLVGGVCSLPMKLTLCASGLRTSSAVQRTASADDGSTTAAKEVTEYRAHRLVWTCWQRDRRLFAWVYRHDPASSAPPPPSLPFTSTATAAQPPPRQLLLRVELRCHAVVCKSDAVAESLCEGLRTRVQAALAEYAREKHRRQNARVASSAVGLHQHHQRVQRSSSMPAGGQRGAELTYIDQLLPARTKFLSVGRHFRPPVETSTAAPKLGVIDENFSEYEYDENDGEEQF